MVKAPNFFIVGAPKCGTSFMHYRLATHPEVFMPAELKEPHHFATDLHAFQETAEHLQWITDRGAYLRLFESAPAHAVRRGEASVYYAVSKTAAHEIQAFDPQAKIVLMLRNPADLLEALHAENRFACVEPEPDFARAYWRDHDASKNDAARGRMFFRYPEIVDFKTQLDRIDAHFPAAQVHVIIQEEMRADTPGTFRRLLEFLDIDPNFTPDLSPENARKEPRSMWAQHLIHNAPLGLRKILRKITSPRLRLRVKARIAQLNSRPASRNVMPPELRSAIIKEARLSIIAVEQRLGRALPGWHH